MRHLPLATIKLMLVPLALVWFSPAALAAAPMLQGDRQDDEEEEESKSYSDVITDEAVTSEGIFNTHMIGDDLFFEIPLDMMEREMLLLTRIAATPAGVGFGGSKANTSTVRWERQGGWLTRESWCFEKTFPHPKKDIRTTNVISHQ